ncbi:proline-rich protein 2-like [Eublepharis macularius]|uniref:Proline-rich protein 2-like n=1 Tax=Eublepharis macularius TaxID=481883 RepID=A0AA97JG83_EUBMA|nr:proline-rich protein 2-like [Eublepharis macularius]
MAQGRSPGAPPRAARLPQRARENLLNSSAGPRNYPRVENRGGFGRREQPRPLHRGGRNGAGGQPGFSPPPRPRRAALHARRPARGAGRRSGGERRRPEFPPPAGRPPPEPPALCPPARRGRRASDVRRLRVRAGLARTHGGASEEPCGSPGKWRPEASSERSGLQPGRRPSQQQLPARDSYYSTGPGEGRPGTPPLPSACPFPFPPRPGPAVPPSLSLRLHNVC